MPTSARAAVLSSVFQLGRAQRSIDIAPNPSDEGGHRRHVVARSAEVHDARSEQVLAIDYRVGHIQFPAGLQLGKQRCVELVEVTIDGDVTVESDEGDDLVTLGSVTVNGETSIETGDDDDEIVIVNSDFTGVVEIDGGDDFDTFHDAGGNMFAAGPPELEDIELVITLI